MTRRYRKAVEPTLQLEVDQLRAEIGRRLLALRIVAQLSQEKFANTFGVKQNTYQKWETGSLFPDPYVVLKICSAYRVHPNFIYAGDFAGLDGEIAIKLAQALGFGKIGHAFRSRLRPLPKLG